MTNQQANGTNPKVHSLLGILGCINFLLFTLTVPAALDIFSGQSYGFSALLLFIAGSIVSLGSLVNLTSGRYKPLFPILEVALHAGAFVLAVLVVVDWNKPPQGTYKAAPDSHRGTPAGNSKSVPTSRQSTDRDVASRS
jgi:hypothetical protein